MLFVMSVGYLSTAEIDSAKCTTLHTLSYEEHGGQLSTTSLSWNSTGSVIAVSYPFTVCLYLGINICFFIFFHKGKGLALLNLQILQIMLKNVCSNFF